MEKETLGYFIIRMCMQNSKKEITDNDTIRAYKKNAKRFQTWCRDNKILKKSVMENPKKYIQEYANVLKHKNLSPATIHSYIVPLCEAFNINLCEIDKPKRTAGTIKKSRGNFNQQGQKEATQERYKRLVDFQKAIGIRRSELAALRGSDLQEDESGYLCIHVRKGKGGKEQWQRILPKNESVVLETFSNVKPDEHVFSEEEMNNKIDLHGMRAEVAREAYAYYTQLLEANHEYQEELYDQLLDRYLAMNQKGVGQFKFVAELNKCLNNTQYVLRGENKQRALEQKKPVSYNRMALMAVNVFHLSHWRLDVGVKNYLL